MTIEASARKLLGVKWAHQGRNPSIAIDCVGLCKIAAEENGYVIKDRSNYGRDPDGSLRKELVRVFGEPVAEGLGAGQSVQPSDLILIQFAPNKPRHVAIVGQRRFSLSIIHADNHRGEVVEHDLDERWRKFIVGVWRPTT